ncbi:hypothetical protein [Trinickia dinghuensis]|uniref:Uncharacterized protein n=1 Tax=Trinickia dinghuensis TaxID=2291023 RepID=A0A3D8JN55_9BURK|nr:hypothetical protein [Trinickia dinghuensis]RDU94539.1 hypothetical protein DWV00_33470 [Trinickia dinghuensis]
MTTEFDSYELSPDEQFANAYYHFIEALKILAEDADVQCDLMGNYNTAWEIKHDVSAGLLLLNLPNRLAEQERDAIAAIVTALDQIPATVLEGDTTTAGSLRAMNHSCWVPLRAHAAELLNLLSSATSRNEAYFRKINPGADV